MNANRIKSKLEIESDLQINKLLHDTPINQEASHNLCRCFQVALKNLPDAYTSTHDQYISIKTSYFGFVTFVFERKPYMVEQIENYREIYSAKRAEMYYWDFKGITAIKQIHHTELDVNELPDDIEYIRTMDGFESVKI